MSNRKTIQINPELFSLSSKKKSRSTTPRQRKSESSYSMKPNSLKKKLIQRIKEHKLKDGRGNGATSSNNVKHATIDALGMGDNYTDEFNDSITYLSQLSKQNSGANRKTKSSRNTVKNYDQDTTSNIHIELELPDDLKPVPPIASVPENEPPVSLRPPSIPTHEPVPYGCLKGGAKPTYKTWARTQKHLPSLSSSGSTPLTLTNEVSSTIQHPVSTRELKLDQLKERMKQRTAYQDTRDQTNAISLSPSASMATTSMTYPGMQSPTVKDTPIVSTAFADMNVPAISIPTSSREDDVISPIYHQQPQQDIVHMPRKFKKTIKRTYSLGKDKKKRSIGVLIKDRKTRKKILDAQRELKKKSINDIKQQLKDRGLIKTGSTAPNDIMRKMYEACMLSGDVTNQDGDVLMHNFLHE